MQEKFDDMSTGIKNRLLRFVTMALVAVMLVNFLSMLSDNHIHSPGNHIGTTQQQSVDVTANEGTSELPGDYTKSVEECGMTSCSLVLYGLNGEAHRLQISSIVFGLSGDRLKSSKHYPLPRPPKALT
ncbi:hypothetical protein GUA87_04965 [Sneathiella sp. P13V-1]|uniref:hypothetical protein n=1 Tax=Sneathiella sp. P13V-1 TaxID=2697366 RepID=UPI00187B21B0|nr:hypothetical protein [Sneathiella sp. P13V-1]MBE7636184.1 hypothetical protein [Sneathiella sp. P13V-1]